MTAGKTSQVQKVLAVGDTIWRFDINRRVYRKRKPGESHSSGPPIYREHWLPQKIVGETTKSWLTESPHHKCPKKGNHNGWALNEKELEDDVYVHEYRHQIAEAIRSIKNADLLRAIAELINRL